MKRQTYKHLAPEVEHLLAAVKAVRQGLIPQKQAEPIHEAEEPNDEQENESEEGNR